LVAVDMYQSCAEWKA